MKAVAKSPAMVAPCRFRMKKLIRRLLSFWPPPVPDLNRVTNSLSTDNLNFMAVSVKWPFVASPVVDRRHPPAVYTVRDGAGTPALNQRKRTDVRLHASAVTVGAHPRMSAANRPSGAAQARRRIRGRRRAGARGRPTRSAERNPKTTPSCFSAHLAPVAPAAARSRVDRFSRPGYPPTAS
jgi:hypothetical protein